MSSLRRRAICVQRARSIARSSIGGRASARTTAPASPGSTSSRSHASRSRTSARWKNAAAPDSRYGHGALLERGGDRLALAADRAHEHAHVLGRDVRRARPAARRRRRRPAPARARSRSARTRPRPPARRARVEPLLDPVRDRARRPRGRRRGSARRSGSSRSRRTTAASGHSARKSAMFFVDAPRKRWIAWSSSPAAVTLPCSATSSRSSRFWAKLVSWNSSTSTCRKRAPRRCADVRLGRAAAGTRAARGRRSRACPPRRACGRGRRRSRRTRARARPGSRGLAVLGQLRRPRRVVGGRDQLVLEPVDPLHDRAEQRARVAAQVVRGERQLVDPLEQHREPVGRGDGGGERVDAGLERLLAQQPRAERVERGDRQLLVGSARPTRASIRSRRSSAAAVENVSARIASGGVPCSASQAKRSTSVCVLPVPAPATISSGPPGWVTASCCAGVFSVTGTFVGYGG